MKIVNKIKYQTVFKIGILNSFGILIRLFTGILSAKAIAVFIGPSGMALMGNFRNVMASIEGIASFGFPNGIVKYVSEYKEDHKKINSLFSTVLIFVSAILIFAVLLFAFFSQWLNRYIFGDEFSFSFLFVVMAFAFPLQVLNGIFVAVLNGLGYFKKVIYLNIAGNVLGVTATVLLLLVAELRGALLGMVISPALLFFLSWYWVKKEVKFELKTVDKQWLYPLFSFSIMALFTTLCTPAVYFYVRRLIIQYCGLEQAGYWEAMQRLSGFYMLFISTLISIYFLPKLSACRSGNEAKQYIKIYQQFILPVFAIGIVVFYIFRNQITTLFLDRSFLPLSDYLFWQLIGDFLKAFALIYGIMFYSYRLVLPYLITESISFLLFYGLSFYWISSEGITGVTKAHSVVYLVYSIILLIYFSRYFNKHFPQPDKL